MTRRAATLDDLAVVARSAPPETAVLTLEQTAAWLQVGCDTVLAMDLPCFTASASDRNLRFLVRAVLRALETRSTVAA